MNWKENCLIGVKREDRIAKIQIDIFLLAPCMHVLRATKTRALS